MLCVDRASMKRSLCKMKRKPWKTATAILLSICITSVLFLKSYTCEECKEGTGSSKLFDYTEENDWLLKDRELPAILFWYSENFGWKDNRTVSCSLGKCLVTKTRGMVKNDTTKIILFYGSSLEGFDLPLPRNDRQLWAVIHEESPKNTWFLSYETGIRLFNYTSTFSRNSDYPITTNWIKDPFKWLEPKHFVTTAEKNRLQRDLGLAPLVYVHSDCHTPSDRSSYITELMKHIQVDSYGRCLNNKEMPENIKGFVKLASDDYYKFLAQYKFQLAFENAICDDYMTEKLFRPLDIGSVPVYRGSPFARDFMPTEKSVIMADDFDSPRELAEYIKKLNADDDEYNSYLQHMETGITNEYLLRTIDQRYNMAKPRLSERHYRSYEMFREIECFLCDEIYKRNEEIKKHVHDPTKHEMPRPKFGNSTHLGCPEPTPSFKGSKGFRSSYYEGKLEAQAIEQMLLAGETNTSRYEPDYLRPLKINARKQEHNT